MGRLVRRYIQAYKLTVKGGGFVLTESVVGTTGKNFVALTITDSIAQTEGYNRAMYLNYTKSAGITIGGEINVLGVDLTLNYNISAAAYAYGISIYTNTSGNPTAAMLAPISIYMDNSGAGVEAIIAIDIGINQTATPTAASRFAFFRLRGHHGTNIPDDVFLLEGNVADRLFNFSDGGQNAPLLTVTAGATTPTHKIAVNIAGVGTRYIKLFSDA
jgi:hypothetical protein